MVRTTCIFIFKKIEYYSALHYWQLYLTSVINRNQSIQLALKLFFLAPAAIACTVGLKCFCYIKKYTTCNRIMCWLVLELLLFYARIHRHRSGIVLSELGKSHHQGGKIICVGGGECVFVHDRSLQFNAAHRARPICSFFTLWQEQSLVLGGRALPPFILDVHGRYAHTFMCLFNPSLRCIERKEEGS